ncbi:MAG: DegT/DnrJ/EryC1/StrS family aminotransferase [Deltaproteobacteria bacterium]|nr:DegT/DnrJ/EryC1/StrS family aminotransferase [Deltaproteobacteria bacterium]
MSAVPLLDLKAQFATIQDRVEQAVLRVMREQRFILGPEVEAFEHSLADLVGAKHAVGVSSGSDALLVALLALGIGKGDEVITSTYSFFASAGSIVRVGATPVLVDIDPRTFNLDPEAAAARVGPRTRALLPVHLFGRCAAVERLRAAAPGLPVVEDAAQALGALRAGKHAGAMGEVGCFSFFPSKNLGGCGDGGMVTTSSDDLAGRLRALRVHGQLSGGRYQHDLVGGNFRLDALQAAVLRVKLEHLAAWTERRRANAARYRQLLSEADVPVVLPPEDGEGSLDVYNQFVIRTPRRDELLEHLRANEIGCAVYYPRGLHQQPCFSHLGYQEGDLPHAEEAARQTLALPVYPELSDDQLQQVVGRISDCLRGAGSGAR